jgi:hypothetical protein
MQTDALDNPGGDMTLSIDIGDELVEHIAERAAELVAQTDGLSTRRCRNGWGSVR